MELDATHAEMMATCECPFDLGYVIGPLQEGKVTNKCNGTVTIKNNFEVKMGAELEIKN
jgi:hypothetical protein